MESRKRIETGNTGCDLCGGHGCRECLPNFDQLMEEINRERNNKKLEEMLEERSEPEEIKPEEKDKSEEVEAESRCNYCESTDFNDVSCPQCGYGRTKQPIKK